MSVGQELLNTPFPEMTQKLALAIAEGQTKLDMNSTKVAKFMADQKMAPMLEMPWGEKKEKTVKGMYFSARQ